MEVVIKGMLGVCVGPDKEIIEAVAMFDSDMPQEDTIENSQEYQKFKMLKQLATNIREDYLNEEQREALADLSDEEFFETITAQVFFFPINHAAKLEDRKIVRAN